MGLELKHHGVKGMKWGIRKTPSRIASNIKSKWDAYKESRRSKRIKLDKGNEKRNREKRIIKDGKSLKKLKRLTDEQLIQKANRLNIENNLKRLSKSLKDKESKKIYKQRHKYSDSEIMKMNRRLQLEENLKNQISIAKANRMTMAGKIRKAAGDIAMSSAVDFIHSGSLNFSKNVSNGAYKLIKNEVSGKTRTRELATQVVNKSFGRNKEGDLKKKKD